MDETNEQPTKVEESFADRVDNLLISNKPLEALALVHDATNYPIIMEKSSDLIKVVVKYLTDENLARNFELHNACEGMLMQIATVGREDSVVIELLDVIAFIESDNTVVSVMKAFQALLLKQSTDCTRAMEWILNGIQQYAMELPLAPNLRRCIDDDEELLLEEEDETKRIISFYIFMRHFYEPILNQVIANEPPNGSHFRSNGLTKRNVLASFIIELYDVPLAYLDLSDPTLDEHKCKNGVTQTNLYTRQITVSLMHHLHKLIGNPLQLIGYGQRRKLWPYDPDDYYVPPSDVFLLDAKVSCTGLAVMFYVLFVENFNVQIIPQIYRTDYLFEMGLYYVNHLLLSSEETLNTKGIRLALKLLKNMNFELLEDDTLDLDIHKIFTKNLIKVLDSTQIRRNSKLGVELLVKYIDRFKTIDAKYFHIQYLLKSTSNNKIRGLLVTIYKNLIAHELDLIDGSLQEEMSVYCHGDVLKGMLLNRICILPNNVETDLLQYNDLIMAALNMLRFLLLRDSNNFTQLWDYIDEIDEKYLKTLTTALECTRAHYRIERKRIIENSKSPPNCSVSIIGSEDLQMTTENQLQVLAIGQNAFEIIQDVLSRLKECINTRRAGCS